jgi:hypothetical protein
MMYTNEYYIPYVELEVKAENLSALQFKVLKQLNSELTIIQRIIEREVKTLISTGKRVEQYQYYLMLELCVSIDYNCKIITINTLNHNTFI